MRSISDTKRIPVLCLTLLLVTVACASEADSAETQAQTPSRSTTSTTGPIQFGEPFAAGAFVNVNRQAGGPANVDLDQTLGTKPVLLYYWIAGNPRADEVFQQVQALADELGSEKLALYGVVFQRNERDVKAVADRVVSLGIKVPVLNDEFPT
jgi:hypothetical protein